MGAGGGRALIALCCEGEHNAEGPARRAALIRLNVRKESAEGKQKKQKNRKAGVTASSRHEKGEEAQLHSQKPHNNSTVWAKAKSAAPSLVSAYQSAA